MGYLVGKSGTIKKNTTVVALVKNWKIDVSANIVDVSSIGDSWTSGAATLNSWKGSMTISFDVTNTEQKALHDAIIAAGGATKLTDVKFTMDGTKNWAGSVWIESFSITTDVNGVITGDLGFKGDGALAYSAT